jgi:hypothetical protein
MTALKTFTTASKQPLTTGRRPDMPLFAGGLGRKLGNTAKSAIRPKGKLRIMLLTAGGLASHLIGRLVFSQPDVNRVPQ